MTLPETPSHTVGPFFSIGPAAFAIPQRTRAEEA
jgi:hypothetical protein